MKIVFVIHSLNSLGGAEKILITLANHLVTHGDDINIILLSNLDNIFTLDDRIKLFPMNMTDNKSFLPKKIRLITNQIKHVVKVTKEINPDVLIGFVAATNIITTIGAKLATVPVVISEHSSYHRALTNGRSKAEATIWKFLRRVVYPLSDHLIILTEEDKPKYHYVKNITIIENPLVLQDKHSNIQRENIILGVGRLTYIKGFDMLIKAFSKLEQDNWKLIITGEGNERVKLQKLINKLNLQQRVSLVGRIDDMEYYYKQSSIFVLSSRTEGFPGALCEAMGYGCCAIAFDCPTGPKEIISHNQNGILVDANNVSQLNQEMNRLINDSQKRELLGEKAKEIRKKLDISIISKKWKTILADIIKIKRGELS